MDGSVLQGRFPASLPATLLPRQGQLSPQQQLVYEDFARIPRSVTAAQTGQRFLFEGGCMRQLDDRRRGIAA